MKHFFTVCIIPSAFALFIVVFTSRNEQINKLLFPNTVSNDTTYIINNYISSFNNDATLENLFLLSPANNKKTIHVIGSSELNSGIPELPHLFLTDNFNANIISYGSAGNQCLSILCQLIAKEDILKNKKIVFIISPGWFESKFAKGSSSEVLLKYNSPRFFSAIANKNNTYSTYVRYRITQLFSDFNNPSLELKMLYLEYKYNQSIFHKLIFMPLLKATLFLIKEKKQLQNLQKTNSTFGNVKYIENEFAQNKKINWTELLLQSKNEVESKVSNNKIGVNDEYYSAYIGKKTGRISAVKEKNNTELEDFKMLVNYVRENEIDAYFIIQPINPLYYKNINELTPIMNIVSNEITKPINGKPLPCLNLFVTDTNTYNKALLSDIMHLSSFGWLTVNKEIAYHYKLSDEK